MNKCYSTTNNDKAIKISSNDIDLILVDGGEFTGMTLQRVGNKRIFFYFSRIEGRVLSLIG